MDTIILKLIENRLIKIKYLKANKNKFNKLKKNAYKSYQEYYSNQKFVKEWKNILNLLQKTIKIKFINLVL